MWDAHIQGEVEMVDIIIGEKVVNKAKETGEIISFDDKYIIVEYKNKTVKVQLNAFDKGIIKYENADLQSKADEIIKQAKIEEKRKAEERKAEEKRKAEERKAEEKAQRRMLSITPCSDLNFDKVQVRLESAPINLKPVRKNDKEVIQGVFDECDTDTQMLYDSFIPKMEYPKYTAHSRSKYCVGFLTKYSDVYVLRVFSRNDVYQKRKSTGVLVKLSDTTEIFRILCVNGKTYIFSKNFAYSDSFYNNSTSYDKWHISDLGWGVLLNKVIRKCDCEYLNDYIEEDDIELIYYSNLLFKALYNNKAEIVFKKKLFASAYRINNMINYLEEFTSKQIDFASQHDVLNTLPIIKRYGIYDIDLLNDLESVMRIRGYGSTYEKLVENFKRLNANCSNLDKKLINFLKKVELFDAVIYNDYIDLLSHRNGITVDDFFDKNYIARHDTMVEENKKYYTQEQKEKYAQVAKELLWIDREENGYFIIVPKTISAFRYEGEMQRNCVYTNGYCDFVIKRQSIIVFLREKKDVPYVTIEFDYKNFDVLQAYGKYNKRIDADLYKYIVNLGKRLNRERYNR